MKPIQKAEPVQKELMHSTASLQSDFSDEIKTARLQKKLVDLTAPELYATLAYCIMLVGIRAENIPGPKEKKMIAAYIVKYFSTTTDADLRLAFELAVAGKLNLSESQVRPYENFSCLYISTIINAYREHFNSIITHHDFNVKMKALPPPGFDSVALVDLYYQEFLKGELNPSIVTTKAFEIATEKCGLKVYQDEYAYFLSQAKEQLKAKEGSTSAINQTEVEMRARIICLIHWFHEQKHQGVKVIQSA